MSCSSLPVQDYPEKISSFLIYFTHVTLLSFLRKQESVKKHGFPLSRE